jgi:hypothetical protein
MQVSSYHGTINTPYSNGYIRRYPRQMTLWLLCCMIMDMAMKVSLFKLFSFGPWSCYPYDKIKDVGMRFRTSKSFLEISFVLPSVLSTFVSGLFQDQKHTFYFKGNITIPVVTSQIEILPEPIFSDGTSHL